MNFAVIDGFASEHGIALDVRIDDVDAARARPEYVADVRRILTWLRIAPDRMFANDALDAYRDALSRLPTFNCRCSRTSTACHCEGRGFALERDVSAAKLRIGASDVVLWRRDDVPAYHLVNVVDDERMGITHVIRGEDLRASSHIHVELAARLGCSSPTFLHHALILDAEGGKLSKSTLRTGEPMVLTDGLRDWVRDQAAGMMLS